MWYIFNTQFDWVGTFSETVSIEINHRYFECDDATFFIPFENDLYNTLQMGFILSRGDQKGYRIHTIEHNEDENNIIVYANGLEGVLNQRVIPYPMTYNTNAENIAIGLVNLNLVNPKDTKRKITGLTLAPTTNLGAVIQNTYLNENLYSVISELLKNNGLGYKMVFDYINKNMVFNVYKGTDRTSTNTEGNNPIVWRSSWGNVRNELFIMSEKDYKNTIYVNSGDDIPKQITVGNATGFDRFEMISDAGDIRKDTKDENGADIVLSDTQLTNLLTNRGNLELYRNFKQNQYSFVLNEDLPHIFGVDFFVGDKISIFNQQKNFTKHSTITAVKELIIQEKSQLEITIDE